MKTTNYSVWIAAALAVACAAVGFWLFRPDDAHVPQSLTYVSTTAAPDGEAKQTEGLRPQHRKGTLATRTVPAPFASELSPLDGLASLSMDTSEYIKLGGDPQLLARNAADAAWLERHGYPTPDEVLNLRSLPIAELERRAAHGDRVGLALLGLRGYLDMQTPDLEVVQRSADLMRQAAVKGSLFAMAHYADFAGSANPKSLGHELAGTNAYALLAETLGAPWVSSKMQGSDRKKAPTAVDVQLATRAVSKVWAELNAERARVGLPPLSPDPRPELTTEAGYLTNGYGSPDGKLWYYPRG